MGWEAVRAWEAMHGVDLPEPYRSFVAEVANGSVLGPPDDSGLLPLGELPDYWPYGHRDIATPFPLTEAWFWEDDPRDATEVEELRKAVYRKGSVVLGESSGPVYWLLIVSGPQRGRVWAVSEVGALPFSGVADVEEAGVAFDEWVRRWHEAPDSWLMY
ncbi:SMI1/KNR4 family protein [Streptomyces sp. SID337]|uniref:SMI1/KNR4 family protein n=2 Tax=Streptomyces TaxID=1883 RepID=UPI001F3B8BB8|nr:SMI1/KNR4 family protein [Streptomyces sp. SID337]